jgi:hypothetical protein
MLFYLRKNVIDECAIYIQYKSKIKAKYATISEKE